MSTYSLSGFADDFNGFAAEYSKRVAYFSMEFAIHQPLKTYSGGLGFLAGSHLRGAYALKQNLIGVGILWKYGYYDQIRKADQTMDVLFMEKHYGFLVKLNVTVQVLINNAPVWVGAYYLPPSVFRTAPLFLLTTDLPQNDYLAQTITHRLYDPNPETRIAAYTVLGIGGAKLLDALNLTPDVYHLNESHPLPLAFYLYSKFSSVEAVKERVVFTTHTPEEAGNPQSDIRLLDRMGFFYYLPLDKVRGLTGVEGDAFNHALGALRLARLSNAVSAMHEKISNAMWKHTPDISPIIHITNAQSQVYWADNSYIEAAKTGNDEFLRHQKADWKKELFEVVADQTGELYDPNILTIVWARRLTGYKRADLLLNDMERFERLISNTRYPIQLIWAGKPYPYDYAGISQFDRLVHLSKRYGNCSVLVGYELSLSKMLKRGGDVWLNTPRITHEASGTSGMTAIMNGALLCSTNDGWVPEFAINGQNAFILPEADVNNPTHEQDDFDAKNLFDYLENKILPLYYETPDAWWTIVKAGINEINPRFDALRLATEYYERLYMS